jgi:hypothetical protein
MKIVTFAAGLAAGYVLGTRAGRERFDQLVRRARNLGNHPTVVQAQDKVKDVLAGDTHRQPPTDSTIVPAGSTGSTGPTTSATARPVPSNTTGATAPEPLTH